MAIESKMPRRPIGQTHEAQSKFKLWVFIVVALCIVGIGGGSWIYFSQEQTVLPVNIESSVETHAYQAVFLDNGQVYFGKLDRSDDEFYVLNDVYYLQSGVMVDQSAQLSLTKLGSEAHGPEDSMILNVDHIMFFEDMRADSKVLQAIQQFNKQVIP